MINGVTHNPPMRRYELGLGDGIAAAYYRLDGDVVELTHTEVPSEYSGQGVGTCLAEAVFEELAATGRKVRPKCPFMSRFVTRYPRYASLIA
jgi:predicted GNAT family acetyltransferase